MNVCIPVTEDKGLESPLCRHFGSAPMFMLVAIDGDACRAIPNLNAHHEPGKCSPLASLHGESLDSVVVVGMGGNALERLTNAGIRVYTAEGETVADAMRAYRAGTLRLMAPDAACAHHGEHKH